VEDAGGKTVGPALDAPPGVLLPFWVLQLKRYGVRPGDAVLVCPSARKKGEGDLVGRGAADRSWFYNEISTANGESTLLPGDPACLGSYDFNGWYTPPGIMTPEPHYTSVGTVRFPTETPVLAEGVWYWVIPRENELPASDLISGTDISSGGADAQMGHVAIPRHGVPLSAGLRNYDHKYPLPGQNNIAFVDGHAASTPLEKLWELRWHKEWEIPSPRPGR
jgi:prepilin-type processing-associated H-X9-DG protein